MTRLYHLPVLSKYDFGFARTPGPGLGNLLFPLARAVIAREKQGGELIVPTWRQIKLGTYLRSERDKRTYGDVFRPRTSAEWFAWARTFAFKSFAENELVEGNAVIRYQGLGRQFHDIAGFSNLVSEHLTKISRQDLNGTSFDIAIHVRLGDFAPPVSNAPLQSSRTPLEWYLQALELARDILGGGRLNGVLFTDEDPRKVINSLGLDRFKPEPKGNALTSMFEMSRARIIIGSRSTFSLWSQYIGRGRAIWPRGFQLDRYKKPDLSKDYFV